MTFHRAHRALFIGIFLCLSLAGGCASSHRGGDVGPYSVRAFGAKGDGKTLDSPAINRAIETADAAGGGTVRFPAGEYLCVSIRLKSNVGLYLEQGATIVAAEPTEKIKYDPAEANPAVVDLKKPYQDYGHCHWHDALIYGDGVENVSIMGPGTIYGKGLVRSNSAKNDRGNKSIALKLCKNVILRDITIKHGGWFGILATGVDNMTIDNLKIDTNRDGMDIDCCRDVRVSNCTVNSPGDDGICPKSSYALGEARPCENISIVGCQVSGFVEGSVLDGTFQTDPKRPSPTGRIKFGTESNGGFKNITISSCIFEHCHGFALETVDGALLEDIAISNITMRDITGSPIFMRLGSRMRGPEGAAVGQCRRITIDNVVCYDAEPRRGCIISGIPGHDIEDVSLSNINIYFRGGGTAAQAATRPVEKENAYPEPTMFGDTPAYGFFIRHAKGIRIHDVDVHVMATDARPAVYMQDVKGADFTHLIQHGQTGGNFVLKDVSDFSCKDCSGVEDKKAEHVDEGKF